MRRAGSEGAVADSDPKRRPHPHAPDTGVAWTVSYPVLDSVITTVGIVLVCAPLAIRAFTRSLRR